MPHLLVTAGNDQHLRLWDTRHLLSISPKAVEILTPPDSANDQSDTAEHTSTHPSSSVGYDKVSHHMTTAKGNGLLRASYQHGKSCSAAYWDPWGRRVITTSYDDKLRSECASLWSTVLIEVMLAQYGRCIRNRCFSTPRSRHHTFNHPRAIRTTARPVGG